MNGTNDGRPSGDLDLWFWLTSQPIATIDASSLQFGQQPIGQASGNRVITLFNNSTTAPLTIKSVAIVGTGTTPVANSGFTETNTLGASLAAATAGGPSSGTINVIFTPPTVNLTTPATAQLSILTSTGGVDNNQLLVSLSGSGVAPALTASVTSLVFPTGTIVGTTPPALTITLKSTGTSQVVLGAITVIAPAGVIFFFNYFSLSNLPPVGTALAPGGSVDILLSFQPPINSLPGTFSAQLSIVNSAGAPLTIPITAVSIAGTPILSASTTIAAFGPVVVGGASTIPIVLANKGNSILNVSGIAITGPQASAFSLSPTPASLQAGQQTTPQTNPVITFRPLTVGEYSAQLQIFSNALGAVVIALSGIGSPPRVGKGVFSLRETVPIGKVPDRLLQDRPVIRAGEAAALEGRQGAATQRAFITPLERPAVSPQDEEPQPEGPGPHDPRP